MKFVKTGFDSTAKEKPSGSVKVKLTSVDCQFLYVWITDLVKALAVRQRAKCKEASMWVNAKTRTLGHLRDERWPGRIM
jgi:hypothetical protein